ncbi:hypothetical protein GW17_00040789, partial [Ensete ventricosum]
RPQWLPSQPSPPPSSPLFLRLEVVVIVFSSATPRLPYVLHNITRRSLPSPKAFIPAPKLQARFQQASSNKRPSFFRYCVFLSITFPFTCTWLRVSSGEDIIDMESAPPPLTGIKQEWCRHRCRIVLNVSDRGLSFLSQGCRSGKRSLMAAAELTSAVSNSFSQGFTGITDIAGGYSAWVQNRLPTEQ